MITKPRVFNRTQVVGIASAIALFLSGSLSADSSKFDIDIKSQNAGAALMALSRDSGVQIMIPQDKGNSIQVTAIKGEFTLTEALDTLLKDTGLVYEFASEDMVVVKEDTRAERVKAGKSSLEKGLEVEEVIVTAQKREQNIMDVPMSIAALSGDRMDKAGITDLQSLSFAVPGMLVQETGSTQRRITIRGIGNVFGTSSLVGIYLDEAAIVPGAADRQIDLRVFDVERVEVLKGPQGTLYGNGSVGGTIRYITNDPVFDSFKGNLSADTSFTRDGGTSHELRGVVNIPLVDDQLALRIAGQYINTGGWVDQPARDLEDINDYDLSNIRAKLLWQPSDDFEIEATAVIHSNGDGATNVSDRNGHYHQAFNDPSTPSIDDDYNLYSLTATYDLGGFNLLSSTSYIDSQKSLSNYSERCCAVSSPPHSLFDAVFDTTVFTQELRIATDGSGPLNLTAGFFYNDMKGGVIAPSYFFGASGGTVGVDIFDFSGFFSEESSRSWAVFSEISYALTQRLEIGAGIRYFEDDRETRSGFDHTAPFKKETFDTSNPRFYLSYAMTDDIRLYANAAKGFRSGGFNAAPSRPAYGPESVWSYELGSKMSLMEDRLDAEVAFFFSDYSDYQVFGRIPGEPPATGNFLFNGGDAEIRGIEASLAILVTEQLELGFTGNYMDTEFVKLNVEPGSSTHAVGDPLDMVPEYGLSLWGRYEFTWSDGSPGFARLDYSQQGESHYRKRNVSAEYHSTSDVIDMLNVRLGWRRDNWDIELYATNLLNEDGFVGPSSIDNLATQPRPRTIGLQFGIDF